MAAVDVSAEARIYDEGKFDGEGYVGYERTFQDVLVGRSHLVRLRALTHAEIYHSPSDAAAETNLAAWFDELAPEPGRAGELVVEGRPIKARRLADGVAWFDFAAVCQGARGAADYIEIAKTHHSVLLSRVPRLTADDEDAARRFITLIDEFYDRGVKLILAADVPRETWGYLPEERGLYRKMEVRRVLRFLAELNEDGSRQVAIEGLVPADSADEDEPVLTDRQREVLALRYYLELSEAEIASTYGVSRPTARSALTALVHEGLLYREANKRACVPRLSREDVEDLFLIRIPIETEVVRLLIERGTVPVIAAARAVEDLRHIEPDAM